jgi:hypothetical protein
MVVGKQLNSWFNGGKRQLATICEMTVLKRQGCTDVYCSLPGC